MWGEGHNKLDPLPQAHRQGAGLKAEQLELKPVSIWGAGIASVGLTSYTTVLAPKGLPLFFF